MLPYAEYCIFRVLSVQSFCGTNAIYPGALPFITTLFTYVQCAILFKQFVISSISTLYL